MNPDKPRTPRTDAIDRYLRTRSDYTKTDHQVWREHCGILETELAAFKKNNEELIQRCNAAQLSHSKTLESLRYNIERTKAFEVLGEMFYKAGYDDIDGIKKIYEIVREKYPIGTYCSPANNK